MTPKTGAIRLATLRLFLPDGGCALSAYGPCGLPLIWPQPPWALPLTGATALCDLVAGEGVMRRRALSVC
ncbi:hypothetical protein J4733_29335 [Klebsiella pneumoniae]|uniref:Uncharacterized protein n=1 Tax=Klebsiella pneumoniae TaxID=573 RepID=A0A939NRZ5_KLEPN|nr:hypothetical protein [Klebsiella pneumoniae]